MTEAYHFNERREACRIRTGESLRPQWRNFTFLDRRTGTERPKVRDRENRESPGPQFYNLAQSAFVTEKMAAAKMNQKLAAQMAGEHPLIKKSQEK
jgi:hypothetical protein